MTYHCPMHPEVTHNKKGYCVKCGMELVRRDQKGSTNDEHSEKSLIRKYKQLLIIVLLILLVTVLVSDNVNDGTRYFMAGFFFVFSGFKLLDLQGFAEGYATYDLLARKFNSYGYIYPFLELTLGVLLVINFNPLLTNSMIFLLMLFSGLGVLESLAMKRKFKCACLGTFIDLPLTTVTLVEDFGMALMALGMVVLN